MTRKRKVSITNGMKRPRASRAAKRQKSCNLVLTGLLIEKNPVKWPQEVPGCVRPSVWGPRLDFKGDGAEGGGAGRRAPNTRSL
eukprot:scaffold248620_cov22-Tisochrysis_lutea.AAC.2